MRRQNVRKFLAGVLAFLMVSSSVTSLTPAFATELSENGELPVFDDSAVSTEIVIDNIEETDSKAGGEIDVDASIDTSGDTGDTLPDIIVDSEDTTGSIVVQPEAEDVAIAETYKLSLVLKSLFGEVVVRDSADTLGEKEQHIRVSEDEEGNRIASITDREGTLLAQTALTEENEYSVILVRTAGSIVTVDAVADDGYDVSEYAVLIDTGAETDVTEFDDVDRTDYAVFTHNITMDADKVLSVDFVFNQGITIEDDSEVVITADDQGEDITMDTEDVAEDIIIDTEDDVAVDTTDDVEAVEDTEPVVEATEEQTEVENETEVEATEDVSGTETSDDVELFVEDTTEVEAENAGAESDIVGDSTALEDIYVEDGTEVEVADEGVEPIIETEVEPEATEEPVVETEVGEEPAGEDAGTEAVEPETVQDEPVVDGEMPVDIGEEPTVVDDVDGTDTDGADTEEVISGDEGLDFEEFDSEVSSDDEISMDVVMTEDGELPVDEDVSSDAEPEFERQADAIAASSVFANNDDFDTTGLDIADFASARLIMLISDPSVIIDPEHVIGVYDNIYLFEYADSQQAMNAYSYYLNRVDAIEPDADVKIAEDTESSADIVVDMATDTDSSEADIIVNMVVDDGESAYGGFSVGSYVETIPNPISALEELDDLNETHPQLIALIDTDTSSVSNIVSKVSVLDAESTGNAHGDKMVASILTQAPDARILSIVAMDNNGYGTVSSIVAGIEYAIDNGATIINLSLSAKKTLATSVLSAEIQKAVDAGIIVVGAAGNAGRNVAEFMPGSVESAYIIGSAMETGERRQSSNYGDTVDYNVVADSTSQATAYFSGFVYANGLDAIADVLNQGLIYDPNYGDILVSDDSDVYHLDLYLDDQYVARYEVSSDEYDLAFDTESTDAYGELPLTLIDFSDNADVSFSVAEKTDLDVGGGVSYSPGDKPASDIDYSSTKRFLIKYDGKWWPGTCIMTGYYTPKDGNYTVYYDPLDYNNPSDIVYSDGQLVSEVHTHGKKVFFIRKMTSALYFGDMEAYFKLRDDGAGYADGWKADGWKDVYQRLNNYWLNTGNNGYSAAQRFVITHEAAGACTYKMDWKTKKMASKPYYPRSKKWHEASTALNSFANSHSAKYDNTGFNTVSTPELFLEYDNGDFDDTGLSKECSFVSDGFMQYVEIPLDSFTQFIVTHDGRTVTYPNGDHPTSAILWAGDTFRVQCLTTDYTLPPTDYKCAFGEPHVLIICDPAGQKNSTAQSVAAGYVPRDKYVKFGYHYAGVKKPKIQIIKVPKYEGQTPAGEHLNDLDGDYKFKVTGPNYSNTVTLTVVNGQSADSGLISVENEGEYTVEEISVPDAQISAEVPVQTLSTAIDAPAVFTFVNNKSGWIEIDIYKSADTSCRTFARMSTIEGTAATTSGSLAGAEFNVYNADTGALLTTVVTDASGHAHVGREVFGTVGGGGMNVRVVEIKAPKGYLLPTGPEGDKTMWIPCGTVGEGATFRFKDRVADDPVTIAMAKMIMNDKGEPEIYMGEQAGIDFSNVEFTLYYFNDNSLYSQAYDIVSGANGQPAESSFASIYSTLKSRLASGQYRVGWKFGFKELTHPSGHKYQILSMGRQWYNGAVIPRGSDLTSADAEFIFNEDAPGYVPGYPLLPSGLYIFKETKAPKDLPLPADVMYGFVVTPISSAGAQGQENYIGHDNFNVGDDATHMIRESLGDVTSDRVAELAFLAGFEDGESGHFGVVSEKVPYYGLQLQKVDSATGKNTPQGDATFEGVTFQVYNDSENPIAYDGQLIYKDEPIPGVTMVCNANGFAKSAPEVLPKGAYYAKEITGSIDGSYLCNPDEKVSFTLEPPAHTTKELEIDGAYFYPDAGYNPKDDVGKGGIKVRKLDDERKVTKGQGNAKLKGAEVWVYNASAHDVKVGDITYKPYISTRTGEARWNDYYRNRAPVAKIVIGEDGTGSTASDLLPYGTYVCIEAKAPTDNSYLLNKTWFETVKIRKHGVIVETELPVEDHVKKAGVMFGKVDKDSGLYEPQGDASLSGAKIDIYNVSDEPVVVYGTEYAVGAKCLTLVTDKDGIAKTRDNQALPVGSYYAVESGAPVGYDTNPGWKYEFDILPEHYDTCRDLKDKPVRDPVWRGGLRLNKIDVDRGIGAPQGNASLNGTRYRIYNVSLKPVYMYCKEHSRFNLNVTRTMYSNPPVKFDPFVCTTTGRSARNAYLALTPVMEIVTDGYGVAETGANDLPYGTYVVIEVQPPVSGTYLINDVWMGLYTIREKGVIVDTFTEIGKNNVSVKAAIEARDSFETSSLDLFRTASLFGVDYAALDADDLFHVADDVQPETPRKAGIYLYKFDPDYDTNQPEGNGSLAGAEIWIYNKSQYPVVYRGREYQPDEVIMVLTTNEKGFACTREEAAPYKPTTDALPVGTYRAVERVSSEGYYRNQSWDVVFTITVNDYGKFKDFTNSQVPFDGTGDGEIITPDRINSVGWLNNSRILKQDPIRGGVALGKVDGETRDVTHRAQGNATFAGAEFTIKNVSKHPVVIDNVVYQPGQDVCTLVIGENGRYEQTGIDNDYLVYGTYEVRETKAPAGYYLNKNYVERFDIWGDSENRNNFHITPLDVADLVGESCVEYPMKIQVPIYKIDEETGESVPQGDASLAGAKFVFKNLSTNPIWYDNHNWAYGEDFAVVYSDENGLVTSPELPLGTYSVREVPTAYDIHNGEEVRLGSEGYLNNDDWIVTFDIKWDLENKMLYYQEKEPTVNALHATKDPEPVIRGGVHVYKIDSQKLRAEPQGDAKLEGAQIGIYNKSKKPVVVEGVKYPVNALVKVLVTDEHGEAESANDLLPYGTYQAKEIEPSYGYNLNTTWSCTFKIRKNHEIVYLNEEPGGILPEDVIRAGVEFQKIDRNTSKTYPQGNAKFQGAQVSIYNDSQWSVIIGATAKAPSATEYAPYDENATDNVPCLVLTADANGVFRSATDALPVGHYHAIETKKPEGYYLNPDWVCEFEILPEDKGKIVKGENYKVDDPVERAGTKFQKIDLLFKNADPHGDTDLSGAQFKIINGSINPVTLPDSSHEIQSVRTQVSNLPTWAELEPLSRDNKYVVSTYTTDKTGWIETPIDQLSYGTYYIIETKPCTNGYFLNNEWVGRVIITEDNIETLITPEDIHHINDKPMEGLPKGDMSGKVVDLIYRGGVDVVKFDLMRDDTRDHGDANLSGATFAIINASVSSSLNKANKVIPSCGLNDSTVSYSVLKSAMDNSLMETITTDATGHAISGNRDLPYGTYYIIETKAPEGYFVNEEWVGKVVIRKDSVIYNCSTINGKDHDLYNHSYYHSIGHTPEVSDGDDRAVRDQIYRGGIGVNKVDAEMGIPFAQGVYTSMAGAEFTIINSSLASVRNREGLDIESAHVTGNPTYSQLRALADNGNYTVEVITTNEAGYAATGTHDLPYGTYYVIETKASPGYWLDDKFIGKVVIRDDDIIMMIGDTTGDSSFKDIKNPSNKTANQTPRRSDIAMLKVDIDGNYKQYIPFLISAISIDADGNETIIEQHVIVCDEYGRIRTAVRDPEHVNGMDKYLYGASITEEGEAYLQQAASWGVWFQGNANEYPKTAVNTTDGALYQAYYRITELQCNDNRDLEENLLESDLIWVANETGSLTDVKPAQNTNTVIHHPLVDTEILLLSRAYDAETESQVVPVRDLVTVKDWVSAGHVSADHKYRMETSFIDLTDGQRVVMLQGTDDPDAHISDDGRWVVKEFRPTQQSGTNNTYDSVVMEANIDTTSLKGHTLMAVDYLYQYIDVAYNDKVEGDWILVARHPHLTSKTSVIYEVDDDQKLFVPSLHTNAIDVASGDRVGVRSTNDVIRDKVSYMNLAGGEVYVLAMTLRDSDTGEYIVKDADGNPVYTYSRLFFDRNATPVSGEITLPDLTIDSSKFENDKSVTVVELLYRANDDGTPMGEPIVEHDSLVDEDQTIRWIDVHTTASESNTLDHVGTSNTISTIHDMVHLDNVIFDDNDTKGTMSYRLEGRLVYQKDFTDENGVTHRAGDTVDTVDGTQANVTITSDAKGNVTFAYDDGTSAVGYLSIIKNGLNVGHSVDANNVDYAGYIKDPKSIVCDIDVELIYKVDSSKLAGATTVVFEDLYHDAAGTYSKLVAKHEDLNDEEQSIHYPQIHTTAHDQNSKMQSGTIEKRSVLIDTVELINLVPGNEYTIRGRLMDQETGELFIVNNHVLMVEAHIRVTEDGKIVALSGEKTTVTNYDAVRHEVDGTIDIVFEFDSTVLEDRSAVAYEELYHNAINVVSHVDLNDQQQTVHYPKIRTKAIDKATKDHVAAVTKNEVVVDTVEFKNLIIGKTYTINGTLVNKLTGEELYDANGKKITATRTFVAGTAEDGITIKDYDEFWLRCDGTVDLTFTFDSSVLENVIAVAFEDLVCNGAVITTHSDIQDEEQTVHFPKIRTSAIDLNTGDEVGVVGTTKISDTVRFWNLIPGMRYELVGTLVDKATGEPIMINGEPAKKSMSIKILPDGDLDFRVTTPCTCDMPGGHCTCGHDAAMIDNYDETNNKVDGHASFVFAIDSSELEGKDVVVFEELYHNGVKVAEHSDINDLSQTIHFPKIRTTAVDYRTNDHAGTVGKQVVLMDTVKYENLVIGKIYKLTGTLMDKATGAPLMNEDGSAITATATFVASISGNSVNTVANVDYVKQSVSGEYKLAFVVDSRVLAGKSVVVFEDLYHNGVEVTTHSDLTDEDQSVYYTDIRTMAIDAVTRDHVGSIFGEWINGVRETFGETEIAQMQCVVDTVALYGLVPGYTYVVSGKLYDVEASHVAGKDIPVKIDGKEITQAVTITVSEDGKSIVASDGSKTSVTSTTAYGTVNGTVELMYLFDGSKVQGKKLVVFEDLYHDDSYTSSKQPDDVKPEEIINSHSDIDDEDQSVSNVHIRTTATSVATGDKVANVPDAGDMSVIKDVVEMTGLVPEMEYMLDGALVDIEASDFANNVVAYLKADGSLTNDRNEAIVQRLMFTAVEADESHTLNFGVTSSLVEGRTLTVFEDIYHNGVKISMHPSANKDGIDSAAIEAQTVYFPKIRTHAVDADTADNMGTVSGTSTIYDDVTYENLIIGKDYKLSGVLVNQLSGDPIVDADGNNVVASVEFTASATSSDEANTISSVNMDRNTVSGVYRLAFEVDSALLAGQTVVVFEDLYHNDVKVATHSDLTDESQSIHYPEIHTMAIDELTGDHVGSIYGDAVNGARKVLGEKDVEGKVQTIVDTVALTNLLPGTYVISGKLYDVTASIVAGENVPLVIDGNEVVQSVVLTVANGTIVTDGAKAVVDNYDSERGVVNGSVELIYQLDSSKIQGKKLVVFEDLYHKASYTPDIKPDDVSDDDLIHTHSDINDEDQSVSDVDVSTTAVSDATGDEVAEVPTDGRMVIKDSVVLTQLIPGEEYVIEGALVNISESDFASGKIAYLTADGSLTDNRDDAIKQTLTFVAASENETRELSFEVVAASVEGSSITVFEDLYHGDVKIATHPKGDSTGWTDDDVKPETVHYPEIRTHAVDSETSDHAGTVYDDVKVMDDVTYNNLVIGKEYTLSGILMNKDTGAPIKDNDGNDVIAKATFVAGVESDSVNTVTSVDNERGVVSGVYRLVFEFSSKQLAGRTVVVFEDLYHNDVKVATHSDLTDEDQSVHYPEIRTTAVDYRTGDHVGSIFGKLINGVRRMFGETDVDGNGIADDVQQDIVDTVALYNLVPGYTYVVSGKLYDVDASHEAGSPVALTIDGKEFVKAVVITVSADGSKIVASDGATTKVTSNSNGSVSGTVELVYTVDSSKIQGTMIVVFEDLYHDVAYTPDVNPDAVDSDDKIHSHSDVDDEDQSVSDVAVRTKAVSADTKDEVMKLPFDGSAVELNDSVILEKLVPGMEYTIDGVLVDIEASDLTNGSIAYVKADGSITNDRSEAINETLTFVATNESDEQVLTFSIASMAFENRTITVFEDLYHNGVKVSTHPAETSSGLDVPAIKAQTVYFPRIRTNAVDSDTNDHVGTVGSKTRVYDDVTYENLIVGKEYVLTGTLMNQMTGKVLVNADGNIVTASAKFIASAEGDSSNKITALNADRTVVSGTYRLVFDVDSSVLAGTTVVAFEDLSHNGVKIATHSDLSDESQSVHYPDLRTRAIDSHTGSHVGSIFGSLINGVRRLFGETDVDGNGIADDLQQEIIDTVSLYNLVPGMTYVVSGELYDKDASNAAGKSVPVMIDGKTVVKSVVITVANDGSSIVAADGSKTTVVSGSGSSVDGTVELVYTVDSSKLQGRTVVVFEDLYHDSSYVPTIDVDDIDGEDIVREHHDIEDEDQSVYDVGIHTTAVDSTTGDHVGTVPSDVASVISDSVELSSLRIGETYVIEGALVDIEASDFAKGVVAYVTSTGDITNDRSEAVVEKLEFTAEAKDETHVLRFAITSDKILGRAVTVFEDLYYGDTKISTHPAGTITDWDEDEFGSQTVYYPAGKTNAVDADTDMHVSSANVNRIISDRVYFENLMIGSEYTIAGQLMFKSDFTDASGVQHTAGEAIDGVVDSVTFVAGSDLMNDSRFDSVVVKDLMGGQKVVTGYVTLNFTVDASKLGGATLVAFESFKHNGVDVFVHRDLNDLPQTIKIPMISTTAKIGDLDEGSVLNDDGSYKTVEIIDTVTYKNMWTSDELKTMADQAKQIRYSDGSYKAGTTDIYSINESTKYIIKGVLMDKATGKALITNGGSQYVVYSEPFDVVTADGTYDVKFSVNAGDFVVGNESVLEGKVVVVFEDMYLANSREAVSEDTLIAEHHDINDGEQDIRFPKARTHAVDGVAVGSHMAESDSSVHEMLAGSSMKVTDTVSFENLHGGSKYVVTGTLQVATTFDGNGVPTAYTAAKDDHGNVITSSVELDTSKINPDYNASVSGTVDLVFNFDGSSLAGKVLVAFETVSRNGIAVATHADITDDAQTVYVPMIHTNATEAISGSSDARAAKGTVIIDKVSYENLEAGKTYSLTGTMHKKSDGSLVAGSSVSGTFVAGTDNQFIFADGTRIMTMAELRKYVTDSIGAEVETGSKVSSSDQTLDTTDSVEYVVGRDIAPGYYKITPGKTASGSVHGYWCIYYMKDGSVPALRTVSTTLANGALGNGDVAYIKVEKNMILQLAKWSNTKYEAVDASVGASRLDSSLKSAYAALEIGVPSVGEATLDTSGLAGVTTVPVVSKTSDSRKRVSGDVYVVIPVDTTALAGETIVAFETLSTVGDSNKPVAKHEDLTDADQSINIPKIRTVATIGDNAKRATASNKMTIVDTVTYSNLTPGVEYILHGELMDKASGTSLKVVGTAKFTPSASNGSATVSFTFDGSKLGGREIVAFERVTRVGDNGVEYIIAKHEDLNDADQTVTIEVAGPDVPTQGVDTGDIATTGLIGGSIAMVLLLVGLFIARRRRLHG